MEGIWPLHPTSLSVPATSLAGPGAMYNIAAAVPRVWMWLTQRALQDTRIQQWDLQVRAGTIFFNHLESQPNVDRISGKVAKLLLAKRIPLSARKFPAASSGKTRTSPSRNYRTPL